MGSLLFSVLFVAGSLNAQSIEPDTHPVQTACIAVEEDGKETTVGYSNDCAPGGDGCIDNTCPGAGASV